jgi:hypothetical protein
MSCPLGGKQRRNQFAHSSQQRRDRRRSANWKPLFETLEGRDLPSAAAHPTYILATPHGGGASPFSSTGPTGTTPAQIRHAYGFDQISLPNGATADGSGQTIAIVDAYDDPNIANDLHQFDVRFGLPDPTFTKVNQNGATSYPAADSGWASEIALDVEWAHAIAPRAKILLVEASDSSYTNLFAAVDYAARQPGVSVVSMSWGGGEFSGESSFDSHFLTPSGHAGVTFVASSGDAGAPASYPAASPNVLAVGGTTASMDSAGNILSESGWSGSGGGISSAEAQPSYQNGIVTQTTTQRSNPDVAYDADPNTGFPVYDTFNNSVSSPWSQFGGTSDAAPQWAALIAIADQGRALDGLGPLDGRTQTLPKIYSVSAADFRDTTSGTSFGSPALSAGPGYDLVTGRGTPHANLLVADLIGQAPVPSATHFSVSAVSSTTAGAPFSITVRALDANNNVFKGYAGTVHFTSSDGKSVLPANYTFTSADAGVHTFTSAATLKTAGSQTVAATDTNLGSISGSAGVAVSPSAATHLVLGQQPSSAAVGTVLTPAPTVRVLDAYNNLVTSDNTDQVTVRLGSNPSGGTLSGTTTVTVSGGVATFGNVSINAIGNGYTLAASSVSLGGATSGAFNVTPNNTAIEGFENGGSWNVANGFSITAYLATWAAHDGTYGLDDYSGQDWIYRSDAAAQLKQGDTASVWLQFAGSADGRAYFGFGASSLGTLSLVAAPNTGQLLLQSNVGWSSFNNLAAVNQGYLPNHWYRLEVDWGASGTIVGKLFDSNGTTLLNSVTASTGVITSGGIAFRAIGSDKYWDTVTAQYGVNSFVAQSPTQSPASGGYGWWGGWFGTSMGSYFGGASSQVAGPWGGQSWLYQFAPALDLFFSGHAHNSSAATDEWLAFLEWERLFG